MRPVFVALIFLVCLVSIGWTEVAFPKTRKAVGLEELYVLAQVEHWTVECVKSENAEDVCHATTRIADLDAGVALDFSVSPYFMAVGHRGIDVDLVSRARVDISTYSNAEHYKKMRARIAALDGQPFDGYACFVTYEECAQGPELNRRQIDQLSGASVAIVQVEQTGGLQDVIIATIEVPLEGLWEALRVADAFMFDVFAYEPLTLAALEKEGCSYRFNGVDRRISYSYDEEQQSDRTSQLEGMRGPRYVGDCPSYVTLAHQTPGLTPAQQELFCLVVDEDNENVLGIQQGPQDAYRRCKTPGKSYCERVNSAKSEAIALTSAAAAGVLGASKASAAAGTTAVAHSSGAYILTGSSGYIAGTLGTAGTTVTAVLTAPATLTTAAVTAVVVGGSVYYCNE